RAAHAARPTRGRAGRAAGGRWGTTRIVSSARSVATGARQGEKHRKATNEMAHSGRARSGAPTTGPTKFRVPHCEGLEEEQVKTEPRHTSLPFASGPECEALSGYSRKSRRAFRVSPFVGLPPSCGCRSARGFPHRKRPHQKIPSCSRCPRCALRRKQSARAPGGRVPGSSGRLVARRMMNAPFVSLTAPWAAASRAHRGRSTRSEEHTSELQSRENLVCRLL